MIHLGRTMDSWHSYPSIYALGHRALRDLLLDPVLVEEKIDGSQFSFGKFVDGLRCRSKGAELNLYTPEKMFLKAIETVRELEPLLVPGWTYRAEYLAKPKHNTLAYDRVPEKHLILFDISTGLEAYQSYNLKRNEAQRLGLELVPALYYGEITDPDEFRTLLDTPSILGGQKVEGLVVKNYSRFGLDKHVLMGKFVSEAFKEAHGVAWKGSNPNARDIVQTLVAAYRSPARWAKAVQHLQEAGLLKDEPSDIGLLMKEVLNDIEKECAEEIKDALYNWAWPKIRRAASAGLPEWYKEQLLEQQFSSAR